MSRLSHQPHVALFSRVLAGEEREEVVQQWLQGQAMLTEACAQWQDGGEVGGEGGWLNITSLPLPLSSTGGHQ